MDKQTFHNLYDFSGKVAVVTGGAGVLCASMCRMLASLGAKVAILDLNPEAAESLAAEIRSTGGEAVSAACDVLDKPSIESAAQRILESFGCINILINGAGGNKPQATATPDQPFFDLPADALRRVFDLNLMGTILPSQVFGKIMAEHTCPDGRCQGKSGVILNISSMNAFRPLTRIAAYSAAKAGVSNFTQWLAVHMAQNYSPNIRVNAIAPGFFVGEQNRRLLLNEDGSLTARGQSILTHTPMNRFGTPDELLGATMWLLSPAATFVTGIVIPVDGGFSAFSGV
jgi:NAD(P)-dependent dehydrogenase (short-subunit alcohol dehydrogenase family)